MTEMKQKEDEFYPNGIKTNEYLKYKATISLKLENDETLKAKHFVKKKTK